jgi:serine/threonine protein kinase
VTPERWQQVSELFERVLSCAPDERATILDEVRASDNELYDEVESLLATYAAAGGATLDERVLRATAREASEALAPLAGTQIGPYMVDGLVGRGGMGEVYRARDARLGRDVALKVLPSSYSLDRERLRRFEQEARAAGMLNHPNVLAVYDVGTHDGSPYLVSELLEGETLRDRLGDAPLDARTALAYAIQVVRGLTAAHERGIVHRDLKPENLFVTRDGRVKILDFGVAKLLALDASASLQTASGVVVGTASYMSPEQAQGLRVDQRSDVFSFGAILYEMLAGRKAFGRPTPGETMGAIVEDEAPSLADAGAVVPPALEELLRTCLAKDPAGRFQSARDLAVALEAVASSDDRVDASPRRAPDAQLRPSSWTITAIAGLGLAAIWYISKRAYAAGFRAGRRSADSS